MIYVLTAVHNRCDITERFVTQLTAQTYPDIQLVLVDDGSTDGTAEMVRKKCPSAVILSGDGNLWWGGAMQKCYEWVKRNAVPDGYILIMNDDTIFDEGYIERGLSILAPLSNTLLTGYGQSIQTGKIMEGALTFDCIEGRGNGSGPGIGNCCSTRSLFMRVGDMLKIGGFHPVLLPHYSSDYEWTMRGCRKYGYRVYCDAKLQYSINEASTGVNAYDKMSRSSVFSKRSVSNPFYKLSFILLSTPLHLIPAALGAQIKRYLRNAETILRILKKK